MVDPAGNEGPGLLTCLGHRCTAGVATHCNRYGPLRNMRIIRAMLSGPIPHRPGKGKLHVHLNHLLVRAYDDGVRDGRAKSPDPGPRTGPSDLPYTGRSGQVLPPATGGLSCPAGPRDLCADDFIVLTPTRPGWPRVPVVR